MASTWYSHPQDGGLLERRCRPPMWCVWKRVRVRTLLMAKLADVYDFAGLQQDPSSTTCLWTRRGILFFRMPSPSNFEKHVWSYNVYVSPLSMYDIANGRIALALRMSLKFPKESTNTNMARLSHASMTPTTIGNHAARSVLTIVSPSSRVSRAKVSNPHRTTKLAAKVSSIAPRERTIPWIVLRLGCHTTLRILMAGACSRGVLVSAMRIFSHARCRVKWSLLTPVVLSGVLERSLSTSASGEHTAASIGSRRGGPLGCRACKRYEGRAL